MQKVVGSNPISRLPDRAGVPQVMPGALAEWLRSGLQSRLHRFDSGRRLFGPQPLWLDERHGSPYSLGG